jgi:polyisoprenyl-teichoic acid--peptidoglycan teichoic acid transferase
MATASGTRSASTPDTHLPVRRERSDKRRTNTRRTVSDRRRDPLWARILIVVGALLMVGSGGVIIGEKYLVNRYTREISQRTFGGSGAVSHVSINGEINFLLAGVDERPDNGDSVRADSIIVMHIPAGHDRAYLISIPRDTYAQIPAFRNPAANINFRGSYEKINSAYMYGGGTRANGFDLLAQSVHLLTGLRFNGGAVVNFQGFKDIVDALGGVDMTVDEKVTSIHLGTDRNGKLTYPAYEIHADGTVGSPIRGIKPEVYEPGPHHFAGWQALDYCRQRDLLANGDGDYGRQRHQQQFLHAMIKGVASAGLATDPLKLDRVLKATARAFTFYGQGIRIEDWIFALKGIDPGKVTMIKTNAGHFNSRVVPGAGSVEIFSDESRSLFASIQQGTIDTFLTRHPDWVSSDL